MIKPASIAAALAVAATLAGCSRSTEQDPRIGPAAHAQLGPQKIEYYGCGSCHTIPGIPGARANVGPPLTAFGRRSYIAGLLANTPPNLEAWITHPHRFRQQTAMPEMNVSDTDAQDIAAYLYTLR